MKIAAYCRVSTDKADQLNSLEAVSYTHLDVYKRQIQCGYEYEGL